jgi:hypothetical protein
MLQAQRYLMWTIYDSLALDLVLGLQIHGYKACVVFGLKMELRCAKCGNKHDQEKKVKRK